MMKKIIISVLIICLVILILPIPQSPLKDGGTRVYNALTYKIVKWNKLCTQSLYTPEQEPIVYKNTSIYWFPENLSDMNILWEEKEAKEYEKTLKPEKQFGGKSVKEIGDSVSDDKDFFIYLKGGDLSSNKPYIEVEWKNLSSKEKCINPYDFDILYSNSKAEKDINKFKGCFLKTVREIPSPALIIPPCGEVSEKYFLEDFNLSQTEGVYCFVSSTAEIKNEKGHYMLYSKLFFEIY